ncbi:Uncharacterised protein [Vibrio cholerae]|nr:Uncharacterised protein [Vibrio cholerae]
MTKRNKICINNSAIYKAVKSLSFPLYVAKHKYVAGTYD